MARPQSSLRRAARLLGAGRVLRVMWHTPLGMLNRSIAEGGPFEQRRTELGRLAMIAAAGKLPPLKPPGPDEGARVSYLSGNKYWYQTLFCFVSLQMNCPVRITPVIFDDGSFTQDVRDLISQVVPWAEFVGSDVISDRLDRLLPVARFPTLRARRLVYPHLRKLTDIHVGAQDWTLVMDSDMLVFRRPDALLDWFLAPTSIFMQDVGNMYGYPDDFMAQLAGGPVPERVNVGLYALKGNDIDWDRVEYWCRTQIKYYGPCYLQEQGLTALLLARSKTTPLCREDYVVLPTSREGSNPTAVIHHYVAHSKRYYYQIGWRVSFDLRADPGRD